MATIYTSPEEWYPYYSISEVPDGRSTPLQVPEEELAAFRAARKVFLEFHHMIEALYERRYASKI